MTTVVATGAQLRELIAAERRGLADALAELPASSWEAPTLCTGWRVRELIAHQTMPFRYSTPRFLTELARSGGRFHRMADRVARRDAVMTPAELFSALRDNAEFPWKPPGGGFEGALTHDVVHGLDFTVPLGLGRRVSAEALAVVLPNVATPGTLKHFDVDLTDIELRAEDMDWSYGTGQVVSGSAQELLLVMCGRRLPAGSLRGDAAPRFTTT
ncbi:MAG: maleylpyruvate isomerase family mycothiol-dependent enzyme [Mycobacteriales bacterium]